MPVTELWSARIALDKLRMDAFALAKRCNTVNGMKAYLHCWHIIDLTEKINQHWDEHPGIIHGDLSAFCDLEITTQKIQEWKEPTEVASFNWGKCVEKFLHRWKLGIDNAAIQSIKNRVILSLVEKLDQTPQT